MEANKIFRVILKYPKISTGCLERRELMKSAVVAALCFVGEWGLLSVSVQEGVPHELPTVTYLSNETKTFEYMANDQAVCWLPPKQGKYQPRSSSYYYREGYRNFLPHLNNKVSVN